MRCIFVQWTAPYFHKDQSAGYNKDKMNEVSGFELHDYEIEFQKLSALKAKKNVGETVLYTDTTGLNYIKQFDIDKYYDEINTEVLDKLTEKYGSQSGKFWTTGKSYVSCIQTEPFIFCDLDFYINEPINVDKFMQYDFVTCQWEIERGKYCADEEIFKQYKLPYYYESMMYPNTSFLFFKNLEILKEYWYLHEYILNNDFTDYTDEWMWLLADQGILGFACRKLKAKIATLEEKIFVSHSDFDQKDLEYGSIPQYVSGNSNDHINLNYNHLWLTKKYIHDHPEARAKFISRTKSLIESFSKTSIL